MGKTMLPANKGANRRIGKKALSEEEGAFRKLDFDFRPDALANCATSSIWLFRCQTGSLSPADERSAEATELIQP